MRHNPRKINGYPNAALTLDALCEHGLTDDELRFITFIDEPQSGRVGIAFRGRKMVAEIEGIEEALAVMNIQVRFFNIKEDRGVIYFKKDEDGK